MTYLYILLVVGSYFLTVYFAYKLGRNKQRTIDLEELCKMG